MFIPLILLFFIFNLFSHLFMFNVLPLLTFCPQYLTVQM
jgi:hypothetical protein